jgi:hypothetical protein
VSIFYSLPAYAYFVSSSSRHKRSCALSQFSSSTNLQSSFVSLQSFLQSIQLLSINCTSQLLSINCTSPFVFSLKHIIYHP